MDWALDLLSGHAFSEEKEIRITGDARWHVVAKFAFDSPTGLYRVGWCYEWYINWYYDCRMQVRVRVDATIVGQSSNVAIMDPAKTEGWNPGSGFNYIELENGEHTVDMAIAVTMADKEIGARRRSLELWRVK